MTSEDRNIFLSIAAGLMLPVLALNCAFPRFRGITCVVIILTLLLTAGECFSLSRGWPWRQKRIPILFLLFLNSIAVMIPLLFLLSIASFIDLALHFGATVPWLLVFITLIVLLCHDMTAKAVYWKDIQVFLLKVTKWRSQAGMKFTLISAEPHEQHVEGQLELRALQAAFRQAVEQQQQPSQPVPQTETRPPVSASEEARPTVNSIAHGLICPITQELPIAPAVAKDGHIYEHASILEWYEGKTVEEIKSPWTRELMKGVQTNELGADEAIHSNWIKNLILILIDASVITGDLANDWKESSVLQGQRASITAIGDALVCPITRQLPVYPVVAMDGHVYDRDAILKHFGDKFGRDFVLTMVYSQQIKSIIQELIDTSVITGNLVDAWNKALKVQQMEDCLTQAKKGDLKSMVRYYRYAAEGGSVNACLRLGDVFADGLLGQPVDNGRAIYWFKKSLENSKMSDKYKQRVEQKLDQLEGYEEAARTAKSKKMSKEEKAAARERARLAMGGDYKEDLSDDESNTAPDDIDLMGIRSDNGVDTPGNSEEKEEVLSDVFSDSDHGSNSRDNIDIIESNSPDPPGTRGDENFLGGNKENAGENEGFESPTLLQRIGKKVGRRLRKK